jgi:hypothetical protein
MSKYQRPVEGQGVGTATKCRTSCGPQPGGGSLPSHPIYTHLCRNLLQFIKEVKLGMDGISQLDKATAAKQEGLKGVCGKEKVDLEDGSIRSQTRGMSSLHQM